MSEHKSSRSRKPLVIGVTLGCVLIALCAAGVAYALHYSARALPNVSVAGQSVSGMTRDEIAQMVDQRAKAMQVNVVVEGHSTPLTLSDMGITVDPQGSADQALAANSNLFNRFKAIFVHNDVPAVLCFNQVSGWAWRSL